MGKLTILALRIVLALALAGSLFVQVVMVPLLVVDLHEAVAPTGPVVVPIVLIVVLGILCLQVTVACVWRLVTMVGRDTVFSGAAFRFVDIIIIAVGAAAALVFALAVVLAPGEAVAPGVVLLICGLSLLVAGIALVILVMRKLLVQAASMRSELNEVI